MTAREILTTQGALATDVIAVLVNGKIVDLHTPIDPASKLKPIRVTDPEALAVIRHSTAHVMADAVQRLFPGTKVTIGPAIADGFYYDFQKPGRGFSEEDLHEIEKAIAGIVARNTPFRRKVVSRDEALATFDGLGENFKVEIIRAIPEDEEVSIYEHGDSEQRWFDVCEGPHVPSTGFLAAVKLTHTAGAYWRGDERNPMLQRIYGTAFPSKAALEEHLKLIEEARQRDHRKLGKELDLVLFNEVAPAMPFFLPKGAYVYNRMVEYVRSMYPERGYEEVITPQVFDPDLFRKSGHLGHYNENMYRVWTEDMLAEAEQPEKKLADILKGDAFGVKPMNCPSHCVIFGSRKRSYRELPWRVADFGRLHRYERGGVVHGLSRVRSFCQDDGHIFCTKEQIATELEDFLKFFFGVYRAFGFQRIDVKLATRPEQRIGTDEDWDFAEGALEAGLKAAGLSFDVLPGEGAFYGPKLEFHVEDALKRPWQLGTFQLDPNLPARFELSYVGKDGADHRPLMIHRAIFGSIERFFSIFLEHTGGNFPTWIAPRQAIILTVSDKVDAYAHSVRKKLVERGLRVDLDDSSDKVGAKIRNARLARYPYLCVVGGREAENGAVAVRSREQGELGAMPVDEFAAKLLAESVPPTGAA